MFNLRFGSVFWLTVSIWILSLNARVASAGQELIGLSDGAATVYQAGVSSVIPVKVKLSNGNPDYIDMTYWATDANGDSVSVSPASARHYLVKGQTPVTDNVVVTAGSAVTPVTFFANAQGECSSPDDETVSQVLNTIGTGGLSSPAGSFSTISAPTLITTTDCTVPVSASLTFTGTVPTQGAVSTKVKLTYTTSPSVATKPVHETMHLTANSTANPTSSVLVHVGSNSTVTFSVTPEGLSPVLNYTVNPASPQTAQMQPYNVPVTVTAPGQSPTQSTGVLQVTAGQSVLASPGQQYAATVTFTPISSGKVTIYYMAQELDAQSNPTMNFHYCIPNRRMYPALANTAITDSTIRIDLSGVASGTRVRFTAIAIDQDGKGSQPGTVDFTTQ